MNAPLAIGILLLVIVSLAIAIETGRLRTSKRSRRPAALAAPRRSVQLEKRMAAAFAGPVESYGDCFAEFSIWRQLESTRMDVTTKGPWHVLDLFARSLVLRHLWHTLGSLVTGSVLVCVDMGTPRALVWSAAETEKFNDCGILAPWIPRNGREGRVGTLISGP